MSRSSITIKMGEKQLSNISGVKTYFSGRTSTGLDIPLHKTGALSKKWSKTSEDTESLFESRITVTSFEVIKPVTLKMFSIYTSIGSRRAYAEILLRVEPDSPRVSINGWHGVGEFIGNAHILTNRSDIPESIEIRILAPGTDSTGQELGLII